MSQSRPGTSKIPIVCRCGSRLKFPRTLVGKVFGGVYQQAGAAERGAARPSQNLPPAGVATPLEVQQGVKSS